MKTLKQLRLLLLLLVLPFASKSQTNVSGGIFSNTTWTTAGSPYIIIDTTVVFPGVTLTIQPGVIVKFNNSMRLEIRQATIIANGTSANPILFTSNDPSPAAGSWANIYLNKINASQFDHCKFSYATTALYADDYGVSVNVSHSDFTNNVIGFKSFSYSMVSYIFQSSFRNNVIGIHGHEYIMANDCDVISNQQGIYAWGLSKITNCTIDSNSVSGLEMHTWNDTVTGNQFRYNGIAIHDYAQGPAAYISQNIIENNNYGIYLEGSADYISCNSICSNTIYNLYYSGTFNHYPVTHNFWCLTDSASIAATIYDAYDDISSGIVDFLPYDTSCYMTGCNLIVTATSSSATCPACADGSVYIQASNGAMPYTFTFYSSPIQNTNTPSGLAAGTYQFCVTDANGCVLCDSITIGSTSCSGLLVASGATNASCAACNDGSAWASMSGGAAPYSYTWYTSPMQTGDTATSLTPGTYYFCATDTNGCTVCDSVEVFTGNCSAFFSLYPDTIPQSYYAVNMASGSGPLSYYWTWGDGSSSTGPYPSHTYASAGFYNICLFIMDSTGCMSQHCSSFYLHASMSPMIYVNVLDPLATSISTIEEIQDISIYPNPSQGALNFSGLKENNLVTILDISGRIVLQQNAAANNMSMDLSHISPGMYLFQVSDKSKTIKNGTFIRN
jgi:hypothetical protein